MIITNHAVIPPGDISRYAWTGLRRFQNVSFVEDHLCRIHHLDSKQRGNARKQATQIRYCLIQAREYRDAAKVATLATKPNLLYYSAMSLALSEILLKQSGLSSLDKAREQHRHHGLELRVTDVLRGCNDLSTAATALRAAPLLRNEKGFGTFELWHRSAREAPVVASTTSVNPDGLSTIGHGTVLVGKDERLPRLPPGGLTLLECLSAIPGIAAFSQQHGIRSNLVRGRMEFREVVAPSWQTVHRLTVHPGSQDLLDAFFGNIEFEPGAVDCISFVPAASGGYLSLTLDLAHFPVRFSLPPSCMLKAEEVLFWPTIQPLNEFGYLYVALYITGNYARYFPDRWVFDVERNAPLALAVEELLEVAEGRLALLTLGELSQTYYVPG